MQVDQDEFQYRMWTPTVKGKHNTVGRSVEWQEPNPSQGSVMWHKGDHSDCARLTHRLLMGKRQEFGQARWSRTIQGVHRSMAPVIPPPQNQRAQLEKMIPHLAQLQQQLSRLGPYKVYTDGGWEYGGEGMDAPFYPPTDTPSHKGGGEHCLSDN